MYNLWLYRKTALDRYGLEKSGFTHIVNAAHGRWNVDTGTDYYSDMTIEYYGVEAEDLPSFNLSQFFYPAAEFIHKALRNPISKSKNHILGHRATYAIYQLENYKYIYLLAYYGV